MIYYFFRYQMAVGLALSVVAAGTTARALDSPKLEGDTSASTDQTIVPIEPIFDTQGDSADTGDGASSECLPSCRGGYMCVRNQCVSPCNPPCDAGQICTRNGNCILAAYQLNSATPTVAPYKLQSAAPVSSEREALNRDMYAQFESKKAAGAAMMGLGSIMIVTAVALGAASGATGQEELLFAGIGVE
jgi:hypothetical protein